MAEETSSNAAPPTRVQAVNARLAHALEMLRGVPSWAMQNRLKAGLLGGGTLLISGLLWTALWMFALAPAEDEEHISLELALEYLDTGNYPKAREVASKLLELESTTTEQMGGPLFVLGASMVYEAEGKWDVKQQSRFYLVGARYLEEARDRDFPLDRKGVGLFLLGRSLHHSRRFAQAIPSLKEALPLLPKNRSEIYWLLTDSYLRDSNPQLKEALATNDEYLADRMLSPEQRYDGLVARARIEFALGNYNACSVALSTVPPDSKAYAQVLVIRGQLLLAEADKLAADPELIKAGTSESQAAERYKEAIKILRQSHRGDTLGGVAAAQSAYLIGVAMRRMKDYRAAKEQLMRTREIYEHTPESLAAGLEEAEVQRELAEDVESVQTYRQIFREAGTPEQFSNPWLTLDQFRKRMEDAYLFYLGQEKYDLAIQLSQAMHPMFTPSQVTQMRARAHRDWAKSLFGQAVKLSHSKAEPIDAQARYQYRLAGWTYARQSKYDLATRAYPEDVWRSAECFMAGRDYVQAVRMLEEYLKVELREGRPRALVALGEALLALGKQDEALIRLKECVEFFPKDPANYQARLLASTAYLEKGDAEAARKMLIDNLHNESLTPRSLEWRDSLFALGRLEYLEGVALETNSRVAGVDNGTVEGFKSGLKELEKSFAAYHQALEKLNEAVHRYPEAPQSFEARYFIGEAYRRAAQLPQAKLETATIETTRIALNRQIQEELNASLAAYNGLQQLFNQRMENNELSGSQKMMLRNCYFAQGRILFDLGRYEDAILAYSTATNRYQHEPESLEAYVQIASCFRRMNKPVEARGTLEQAKIVLKRIRHDANFTQTTRYDRTEWESLLDWLSNL